MDNRVVCAIVISGGSVGEEFAVTRALRKKARALSATANAGHRERQEARGLCSYCCGVKLKPGRRRCQACMDKAKALKNEYRRNHKALGLCRDCPKEAEPGRLRCRVCQDKNAKTWRDCKARRRALGQQ